MSFYHDFSNYYDQIFPTNQDTVDYFQSLFRPSGRILDVGTGAGGYAIEMASRGFSVDAIDFDSDMISIAQNKNKKLRLPVDFQTGDMLKIDALDIYDGIYCIGNTFVHLNSSTEMKVVLGNIFDALKPEGWLALQIVNYDRSLNHKITSLPTLRSGDVEFVREYGHVRGIIEFKTTLRTPSGTFKNQVELYPIRQGDLFQMLVDVGFHEVRSYGDFKCGTYDSDKSFMLVMKARKP